MRRELKDLAELGDEDGARLGMRGGKARQKAIKRNSDVFKVNLRMLVHLRGGDLRTVSQRADVDYAWLKKLHASGLEQIQQKMVPRLVHLAAYFDLRDYEDFWSAELTQEIRQTDQLTSPMSPLERQTIRKLVDLLRNDQFGFLKPLIEKLHASTRISEEPLNAFVMPDDAGEEE